VIRPIVLILRALGLGDLLTAVPAVRALARAFPHHRRVLAAPAALAPLAHLTGAIDDVLDTPTLATPSLAQMPDVAVNLHGHGPQSHQALLALWPRRLIAFAHPEIPRTAGAPAWRQDEHEVHRWCRLLEGHGVPADPSDLDLTPPVLPAPGAAAGATVMHPGAASPARRWPPARWAAVARAERQAGRRVLVTGGAGEARLARRVAQEAGLAADAVHTDGDVLTLAAVVAAAGRVVVGDTGVAHLATALGTPSIVLFGPTPPARWGPPAGRRRHRALWAGRTGDPHAAVPDPGLLEITVDDVLAELAALDRAPAERAA
jgi:ADP-heptose:LPS heptosyltransferase